jgi:hypothetical protein
VTHDELLAKLDYHLCVYTPALRAVVEYHKPYESKNYGLLCGGCDEDPNYPCGTIQAIEKELK